MSDTKNDRSLDLKTATSIADGTPSGTSESAMSNGDDELGAENAALGEYVVGTVAEKKLLRKVDFIMIPSLWFMCVMAYLDRNNIGNANAAGMSVDLNLTDSDYSMLVTIFFIGYLIFEVPSNLVIPKVRPSWYIAGLAIVWGSVLVGMSQAKNYGALLACRFLLGAIEAGFLPGVLFIMTCWYKNHEIGKRFAIFFTALTVSGAFSGLLSGAIITGLSGHSGLEGWRWLFLIEGLITVAWGFCIKFIMLDYPKTENGRMTPSEIHLATVRLLHDRKMTVDQGAKILPPWEAVKAAVLEPKTWFFTMLYFLANGCATISYFLPTILQQIGYTGVKAQWMTVPIWVVATLFLLVVPQISDRVQNRRWFVSGAFGLAFISSIIIIATPGAKNSKLHYAFYCFYFSGIYSALPLTLTWASESAPFPKEKRAVMVAIISSVGNLSAIYGSRLWPKTTAPKYTMGFASMASFTGFACLLAAVVPFGFKFLTSTGRTKAEREVLALQATRVVEQVCSSHM